MDLMGVVTYKPTSPYAITPQTSFYLGYLAYRAIIPSEDDVLITIDQKYQNRPDLLSQTLYNTTDYWWVFMIRNPDIIQDPIYDLVAGTQLYVPSLAAIQAS
jgi:hypothetical protein